MKNFVKLAAILNTLANLVQFGKEHREVRAQPSQTNMNKKKSGESRDCANSEKVVRLCTASLK